MLRSLFVSVFLLADASGATRSVDRARTTLQASGGPTASNSTTASGTAPTRFIIYCHGRDGSTELALTLGHLTDSPPWVLDRELFGTNKREMSETEHPEALMETFFEDQQAEHPTARLLGFKWKPFFMAQPQYLPAWEVAGEKGYRVLWLLRNPLDISLSLSRHEASNNTVSSHCATGNATCIAEHASIRVTLDTTTLLDSLDNYRRFLEILPGGVFSAFKLRHHLVHFEDLFAGEPSSPIVDQARALDTWNGVLSFLGQPTLPAYTHVSAAINAANHAPTHPASQCDSLTNADEVRRTLSGTRHAHLLRC